MFKRGRKADKIYFKSLKPNGFIRSSVGMRRIAFAVSPKWKFNQDGVTPLRSYMGPYALSNELHDAL